MNKYIDAPLQLMLCTNTLKLLIKLYATGCLSAQSEVRFCHYSFIFFIFVLFSQNLKTSYTGAQLYDRPIFASNAETNI